MNDIFSVLRDEFVRVRVERCTRAEEEEIPHIQSWKWKLAIGFGFRHRLPGWQQLGQRLEI